MYFIKTINPGIPFSYKPYKTHRYTLLAKCTIFNAEPGGTHLPLGSKGLSTKPSGYYMYHTLYHQKSTFCPQSVFIRLAQLSQQITINSTNSTNWMVSVTRTVYSSLTYHYTHIHTMLVLQRLVSEMCCSSLNMPPIQSFKMDTRHKSMQGQKLKSKNICFSTKASNSDDHKHCCKCISVPEELPASNIRAASLQTEVQVHQFTKDHIPQGKNPHL